MSISMFATTIEIPAKLDEGEEWKQNQPENLITLPAIIIQQSINPEKLSVDSAKKIVLENMQEVIVIPDDNLIVVGPKGDTEEYLARMQYDPKVCEEFIRLLQVHNTIAVEFRIAIDGDETVKCAIGGLWDGFAQEWMFDLKIESSAIWE